MTQRGRSVAILKSLYDDSHVKTRLCQYEAHNSEKDIYIAKQIVKSRLEGQNFVLRKHGLKPHSDYEEKIDNLEFKDLKSARLTLTCIEGKYSEHYFRELFQLLSEKLRPEKRSHFKAYAGGNNLFNLGSEVLKWKVHKALLNAKLEPFLGFLHSEQYGKPNLVCDFQELYRYLIEDFLIVYCQNLKQKDFYIKTEDLTRKKKGKRQYLNPTLSKDFMNQLDNSFKRKVEVSRMRISNTFEMLISEEALVLTRFLRDEKKVWTPRIEVTGKSSGE